MVTTAYLKTDCDSLLTQASHGGVVGSKRFVQPPSQIHALRHKFPANRLIAKADPIDGASNWIYWTPSTIAAEASALMRAARSDCIAECDS